MSTNTPKITVYATNTCTFCHGLTAWLDSNKISYEQKMVDTDMEAQKEMLEKLQGNFQGVPVTSIDDSIVVGFDREGISAILKEKGVEINASRFIFE